MAALTSGHFIARMQTCFRIGLRGVLFLGLSLSFSCLTVYDRPVLVPKGSVKLNSVLIYALQPSPFGFEKFSGKRATAVEFLLRKAGLEFNQYLQKEKKRLESRAGVSLKIAGLLPPFLGSAPQIPPALWAEGTSRVLYGRYEGPAESLKVSQYQLNGRTLRRIARTQGVDGILVPYIEFIEKPYRVNSGPNRYCFFKRYLYVNTYYMLFSNEGEVLLDSRAFHYVSNVQGFTYRKPRLFSVLSYSVKGRHCKAFVNPNLRFTDFSGALNFDLMGSLK